MLRDHVRRNILLLRLVWQLSRENKKPRSCHCICCKGKLNVSKSFLTKTGDNKSDTINSEIGLQSICQEKKLGKRWQGRSSLQALPPLVDPTSRASASWQAFNHILLAEFVFTSPSHEESPECLQNSHRKAQHGQSSIRRTQTSESFNKDWKIARPTLGKLAKFYQNTGKAFHSIGRKVTSQKA